MNFQAFVAVTDFVTRIVIPLHEQMDRGNMHLNCLQDLVVKPKEMCDYKVRWHYNSLATSDSQTKIGNEIFGVLTGNIWKGNFFFNNRATYLQVALSKEIEKGWNKQLIWVLAIDCEILILEQNKAAFVENIKQDADKNHVKLTEPQTALLN
jgi:hypothetical protein